MLKVALRTQTVVLKNKELEIRMSVGPNKILRRYTSIGYELFYYSFEWLIAEISAIQTTPSQNFINQVKKVSHYAFYCTFYRLNSPPIVFLQRDLKIFFFFFSGSPVGFITARIAAKKTSLTPSPVRADVS